VPEAGAAQVLGASDAALEVHRRSHADGWYARLVLPDAWLSLFSDRPTSFAFVRRHGDGRGVEAGPGVALPWRLDPAPITVDLSAWDDA